MKNENFTPGTNVQMDQNLYDLTFVNCNNVVNKHAKYMAFSKVTRLTKRCNP